MLTLCVIAGIPGSGKTTLAQKLAEQYGAIVHSYDAIPGANTKASMNGSVKRAWTKAMHDDLRSGKNVVCDGINLTVKDRKEMLSAFADIPCKRVLVGKNVPLEICLQRNRERQSRLPDFVVKQAARLFEPPDKSEGWDEVIVYND